jgi:hypothetical protein
MTDSLSIVDFMESPTLFEPWFEGSTWDNWRAVMKALYCLPMDDEEIAFFRTIAERDPPRRPVREAYFIVGRGGGKDSIASAIAAHSAALFDGTGQLRPGERAMVACLAVDRDQASIVKNYTKAFFSDIPLLQAMVTRETANGIELNNGVDVTIATNSFRSVRGRSILCCIFDECAYWADENSATPDEEVYRAVRPALARVPGSIMIGISSPYRKSGLLWRKFKKHYGRNDDDVLVIRAPSKTLNPKIDQAEIDKDLADDPARARAEWFAEWRDDVSGWLELEKIEACVDRGVMVRPPSANGRFRYRSGCDPSGGAKDSFTLAIAHDEGNISVLDCIVEIKPPFNSTSAVERIAAALKEYGLHRTIGDRYAAGWVVDAFAKCGIKYEHSERDRSLIYLDVLPLFTSGRVRLLDSQKLITQFASLERKTSSLGKDRVDHGVNGHDDVCNAAALALISKRKGPMVIPDSVLAWASSPETHGTTCYGPNARRTGY